VFALEPETPQDEANTVQGEAVYDRDLEKINEVLSLEISHVILHDYKFSLFWYTQLQEFVCKLQVS